MFIGSNINSHTYKHTLKGLIHRPDDVPHISQTYRKHIAKMSQACPKHIPEFHVTILTTVCNIYIYIYIYIYISLSVRIYIHICVFMYMYVCVYVRCVYVLMCTGIHVYMHIYTHMYTRIIYILCIWFSLFPTRTNYIHMHIYIHIYV